MEELVKVVYARVHTIALDTIVKRALVSKNPILYYGRLRKPLSIIKPFNDISPFKQIHVTLIHAKIKESVIMAYVPALSIALGHDVKNAGVKINLKILTWYLNI